MTLASVSFLCFLAVTAAVYFSLPRRWGKLVITAADLLFYYLLQPSAVPLLIGMTVIAYFCAIAVEIGFHGRRRLWLVLGQCTVLGCLFAFKYLGFFCSLVPGLRAPELILPVGISFYSFTVSAYLFDVYRGKLAAEHDPLAFAAFVSFFPSLLSGPINRADCLLPQLRERADFDSGALKRGLLRFALGAVKKLVLADTLAIFVNAVYADISACSRMTLLLCIAAYSLQIYFDFSGYTDMALGAAELLGIRLPENFRAPYLTRSVKSFWKSWHISLTSWFRDYLYIPLGGSRVSKLRTCLNVLTVFAVSGLWHGAEMSFILWGLLNGIYQVLGQLLEPALARLRSKLKLSGEELPCRLLRGALSFCLISVAWVFFRAADTGEALLLLKSAVLPAGSLGALGIMGRRQWALVLLCTALFTLYDLALIRGRDMFSLCRRPFAYWISLGLLAAFVFVFGVYGEHFDPQVFVYFRF